MALYLGKCVPGFTSFTISVTVPQVNEDPLVQSYVVVDFLSDPIIQIARGLWRISFRRTLYPHDGTPHSHPVNEQQFWCAITDGSTMHSAQGLYLSAGWPCKIPNNNGFTDGYNVNAGEPLPENENDNECHGSFLVDFGCVACQIPVACQLWVFASSQVPFGSMYSFKVSCHGEQIG